MVKTLIVLLSLSSTASTLPPDLQAMLPRADFTVVEFFSSHCPCQRAHDARLKELATTFAPNIQFVAVDSEATATVEDDARERAERGYPFPIITDVEGKWADALSATYATYITVLTRQGEVVYKGGVDSNKQHVTDDASFYLRDALDALSRGQKPSRAEMPVLGCVLRRQ